VDGHSPGERASQIAEDLRRLLEENLLLRQVRLSPDHTAVLAAGVPLIQVLPGDAQMAGTQVAELAQQALTALQGVLWKEELDRSP